MNQPRGHHIVPQFYLKWFARGELIEVVERADFSKVFQTSPQHALAEKQFYTLDVPATGPDLWVEQELFAQTIEPGACRAIGRVIDQEIPLSRGGLRLALARFIVFQFVRGQVVAPAHVRRYRLFSSVAIAWALTLFGGLTRSRNAGSLADRNYRLGFSGFGAAEPGGEPSGRGPQRGG